MRKLAALLLALAATQVAFGQSLGEAARKEAERRRKNREAGVHGPSYTGEDIDHGSAAGAGAKPDSAAKADPAAKAEGADEPEASASPASPRQDALDADAADRQEKERYWRGRKQQALARRDEAKRKYDALNKLWLAPNEYYVDEKGQTVIPGLDDLRQRIAKAKADWDAAEKALLDLDDEARRAGALPGWLR